MSLIRKSLALLLVLAAALALPAVADQHEKKEMELAGYLADFHRDFEFSNGRLLELAEAFPADKYGWRPAEGVRSVSEVLVHVAAANYFFASQFGVDMPEGLSEDAEKTVTAKEEVIAMLKGSMEHIGQAANTAKERDLDETVEMFGRERSWRSVLMIVSGHGHEHLGQAIAYARSNGVVPPWSQPQEGSDG
jgi:uncharacterized damage-inducible protein DinB